MFSMIVICLKYLCSEELFSNAEGNYFNNQRKNKSKIYQKQV